MVMKYFYMIIILSGTIITKMQCLNAAKACIFVNK